MIFSEQTDKLMPAVIKAWSDIKAAVKDSVNPHLKNHYADLASVMDAVKKPLADNDLAVLQPVKDNTSSDPGATVETYIMHSSGQYMMSEFSMSAVDRKPQTIGATITYLRRVCPWLHAWACCGRGRRRQLRERCERGSCSAQLPVTPGGSTR